MEYLGLKSIFVRFRKYYYSHLLEITPILNLLAFLYVRRMYIGIQFPELFSSEWPETFFVGILDILEYKSIIKKNFVILSFCDSVTLWSVTYLTRFLYLNIIQSSPNLAQMFIWVVSRDGFLFFSNFQFLPPRGGL